MYEATKRADSLRYARVKVDALDANLCSHEKDSLKEAPWDRALLDSHVERNHQDGHRTQVFDVPKYTAHIRAKA